MTTSDFSMPARKINVAEWVITILVLAVLAAAYLGAQDWPRGAAFFPVLLSGAGIVLAVVKIVAMAIGRDASAFIRLRRAGESVAVADPATKPDAGSDEELADEDGLLSDFAAASLSTWAQAIGFLAAFFLSLYLLGLLVTLPTFTVLYLRFVARMSWLGTVLYVLATSGLIYVLFVLLLHLPLPEGVLLSIS